MWRFEKERKNNAFSSVSILSLSFPPSNPLHTDMITASHKFDLKHLIFVVYEKREKTTNSNIRLVECTTPTNKTLDKTSVFSKSVDFKSMTTISSFKIARFFYFGLT